MKFRYDNIDYPLYEISNREMRVLLSGDPENAHLIGIPLYFSEDGQLFPKPAVQGEIV